MLLYLEIDSQEVDEFYKKIAQNVKKLRIEKCVTQTDLALSIGHKSVSTIAKIEAGLENKHYNLEQLYKISKAFGIDIKSLLEMRT